MTWTELAQNTVQWDFPKAGMSLLVTLKHGISWSGEQLLTGTSSAHLDITVEW
jgi:hypothetical protein